MTALSRGRLSESQRKALKMLPAALGPALVATVVAAYVGGVHLIHATLAGVWFATTLGIGAIVFVLAQHALQTSWAVVPRRPMEWLGTSFAYALLTAAVLGFVGPWLYRIGWSSGGLPGSEGASSWFTGGLFWVRTLAGVVLLAAVGSWYAKRSARQDVERDPAAGATLRRLATPALVVTLAAALELSTDWILAIHAPEVDPTIALVFTAYAVAGGLCAALAVALIAMVLFDRAGLVADVWTGTDRGRLVSLLLVTTVITVLLMGVLVWLAEAHAPGLYAAWSAHWLRGSWRTVSYLLAGSHVAAILLLLALRGSAGGLLAAAGVVLFARYLDAFQLVLPEWSPDGPPVTILMELIGLAVGLVAPWVAFFMRLLDRPIYPLGER